MTDPEMDDFDEALDDGIDAVILDRMTDTLMILQCKQPHRGPRHDDRRSQGRP